MVFPMSGPIQTIGAANKTVNNELGTPSQSSSLPCCGSRSLAEEDAVESGSVKTAVCRQLAQVRLGSVVFVPHDGVVDVVYEDVLESSKVLVIK